MFSGQVEFEPSASWPPSSAPSADSGLRPTPKTSSHCQSFHCTLSDRHQLRLLQLRDAEELFALIEANRSYLKQWLSWLETTQTVEDTQHFIRLTRRRAQDNQGFAAAVCYDGNIAGVIGMHDFHKCDRKSSIGYWLAQSQQHKGLMSASCKALIDYGFNQLNLNRISILCATGNTQSRAIPERLGFTHEGTLRQAQWIDDRCVDHEIYAMLRHEWVKPSL